MVTTLFENEDLRLSSTGHDYDFVGTIEVLNDKPLTFFFAESLCQVIDDDGTEYDEWEPDEDETKLLDVYAVWSLTMRTLSTATTKQRIWQ